MNEYGSNYGTNELSSPQWNKTYEAGTRQLSPRIRKKKGPVRFVLDPEYIAEVSSILHSHNCFLSTSIMMKFYIPFNR